YFYFFFSSRRRHTRSKRDWSSDVCSSDLSRSTTRRASDRSLPRASRTPAELSSTFVSTPCTAACSMPSDWPSEPCWLLTVSTCRSEERRVGKECRSRGSPGDYERRKVYPC